VGGTTGTLVEDSDDRVRWNVSTVAMVIGKGVAAAIIKGRKRSEEWAATD
jgi:hypothetical protein